MNGISNSFSLKMLVPSSRTRKTFVLDVLWWNSMTWFDVSLFFFYDSRFLITFLVAEAFCWYFIYVSSYTYKYDFWYLKKKPCIQCCLGLLHNASFNISNFSIVWYLLVLFFQVHCYVQSHIQMNEYRDRVILVNFGSYAVRDSLM